MRVFLSNLTLILGGMGAAVGCHADGVSEAQAATGPGNETILCAVTLLYPCLPTPPTPPSSQTTAAYNTGRQGIKFDPQPNSDRDAIIGRLTLYPHASDRDINFKVDSMGAGLDTSIGRLAFSMTLDNYYQGALYNNQDLWEPFKLSFKYGFSW